MSFTLSAQLTRVILQGSPSLLWMAANHGDSEEFQMLLSYLPSTSGSALRISPNPGGLSVVQTALLQNHGQIQQCLVNAPHLFPRFVS